MNNAIEHSGGDKIIFSLQKDPLYTEISIVDNGVGIFRNIQKYADKSMVLRLIGGRPHWNSIREG